MEAGTRNSDAAPSPFLSSVMRVEPAWIDYNGHLNMAYYMVLFDRAVDEAFEAIGLGQDYLATRGASYFTAETHTVYRRELPLDSPVRVAVQIVGHDEKRVHTWYELRHAEEGWLSATCEQLHLHVDMTSRAVSPFPPDVLARLTDMAAAHALLPRPDGLGRSVGLKHGRGKRD